MKNIQFEKTKVIELLGGTKLAADFFDCRPQAIYQWEDGKPIPEKRILQCLLRRPELFQNYNPRP